MKYYVLLIFIACSIHVQAQTYEGKIGNYPIFLELDMDYSDNRVTAFYFYKSHLKNIRLEGTCAASELTIFEEYTEKEEEKELFTLTINKDKLSGTWKKNGHTLNVNLTKTTKRTDQYKLENLDFIRDSITIIDKKELVWFTEKHSNKTLFRLGNGFSKVEREFINPKLDSIHTNFATIGLECGWADINIETDLISNQYISFTEHSSIYCGGAHPSHITKGYNFDLKNKVQLSKLTDIYPNLNHYQLLKKKYKNDSNLDSECDYFTDGETYFNYYSWVLTTHGITITPSYPHVMTPCEIDFTLTYKELH
jgi:hypothetical protein